MWRRETMAFISSDYSSLLQPVNLKNYYAWMFAFAWSGTFRCLYSFMFWLTLEFIASIQIHIVYSWAMIPWCHITYMCICVDNCFGSDMAHEHNLSSLPISWAHTIIHNYCELLRTCKCDGISLPLGKGGERGKSAKSFASTRSLNPINGKRLLSLDIFTVSRFIHFRYYLQFYRVSVVFSHFFFLLFHSYSMHTKSLNHEYRHTAHTHASKARTAVAFNVRTAPYTQSLCIN